VSGNQVKWTNMNGQENPWWNPDNTGAINMSNNMFGDTSIGADIWNETFPQCGSEQ
jgi:hypothetical protein